jgi:hypothetical protein
MDQISQTSGGNQEADSLNRQTDEQPLQIYKPRRWLPVLVGTILLAAAVGGGWAIVWISSAFTDVGVAANFVVVNILSLLVFLAIVTQACIYWAQRSFMKRQWEAMEQGLERTDLMIEKMQGQLDAINRQEGHLSAQAEAAKTQAVAMQDQLAAMEWHGDIMEIQAGLFDKQVNAMQGQLEVMRRQMENAAITGRAYLGIKGVGIENPIVNNTIVINAVLVNGGQTPAWNFEQKFQVGLAKGPPPPFDWNVPPTQISDAVLTSSFFPAGAEKRITFPKILSITKEHFDEFERGARNIYVDGEVRFTDQMGIKQIFGFGMICTSRDNGQFRERYQYQRDANPN